jgi:hypothetical protein
MTRQALVKSAVVGTMLGLPAVIGGLAYVDQREEPLVADDRLSAVVPEVRVPELTILGYQEKPLRLEDLDVDQETLAPLIGLSPDKLSKLELGRAVAAAAYLERANATLNVIAEKYKSARGGLSRPQWQAWINGEVGKAA